MSSLKQEPLPTWYRPVLASALAELQPSCAPGSTVIWLIQLLGHWKSDAMLCYLRVAATANIQPFRPANARERLLQPRLPPLCTKSGPSTWSPPKPLPVSPPSSLTPMSSFLVSHPSSHPAAIGSWPVAFCVLPVLCQCSRLRILE